MLISWTVLMLLSLFLACPACEVNQKVIVRGKRAGRRQQELRWWEEKGGEEGCWESAGGYGNLTWV